MVDCSIPYENSREDKTGNVPNRGYIISLCLREKMTVSRTAARHCWLVE